MRTLVVEDEPRIARFLVKALARAGHEVDTAEDAGMALAAARATHYDLITLDLGLPDADGREVLGRLRSVDATAAIVVVTADVVADADELHALGASDVLRKPVPLATLLDRLRRAVAVPRPGGRPRR